MKYLYVLCVLSLAACSKTPVFETGVSANLDDDGLAKVSHSGFDKAYVDADAKISSYKSFMFAPLDFSEVDIVPPENASGLDSEWELTDKDKQLWNEYYLKEVTKTFGKYMPVATEAGPDVALIKSSVTHFAPNTPKFDSTDRGARDRFYAWDSGNITIKTQVLDSSSNQLLANLTDNRDVGNDAFVRESTRAQFNMDLRNTFSAWARNLGKNLGNLSHAAL